MVWSWFREDNAFGCRGLCSVDNLDKNSERKREKGKGWAYVLLGMYDDIYDEDKSHLDNDPSSYEFYEISSAGGKDFYWMVDKWNILVLVMSTRIPVSNSNKFWLLTIQPEPKNWNLKLRQQIQFNLLLKNTQTMSKFWSDKFELFNKTWKFWDALRNEGRWHHGW